VGVIGDHRCLWLDLPEQWIFGGNMPEIVRAGARRLKSDDPCTRKCYLDNLEKYFNDHLLLQKVQQIETDLLTQQLQPHHKVELEHLDTLCIQGMIYAKQQCRKLHTRLYGWTPVLTQLMTELRHWHGILRQAQGCQINAHLMHRLARALGITAQPRPPMDTIQEK